VPESLSSSASSTVRKCTSNRNFAAAAANCPLHLPDSLRDVESVPGAPAWTSMQISGESIKCSESVVMALPNLLRLPPAHRKKSTLIASSRRLGSSNGFDGNEARSSDGLE
jgi:hypothetical protein